MAVSCRNDVDLRVPSAARFADALWPARLPRPGAVGMHLDAGAIKAEVDHRLTVHFLLPKRGELPLEYAVSRPAAEPGVDREPIAETPRQGPPLAAVLHDMQNRVDDDDVRNPNVPTLRAFFIKVDPVQFGTSPMYVEF